MMLSSDFRLMLGLLIGCWLLSGCSSAEPEAEPTLPTKHIVQSGDTLTSIAVKFYGNPSGIHRILKANSDVLKDPNRINAGQLLVIPEISNESEGPHEPDVVAGDASVVRAPQEDDGPSDVERDLPVPPTTHVVRSDETLQEIAQHYYGSPDFDSFIAASERNKGLIRGKTVASDVKLFIPPLTDDMPVH